MASTNKRPRTSSASVDPNSPQTNGASPPSNPPSKAMRVLPFNTSEPDNTANSTSSGGHPLLCSLPPTCHHHPTPISDTNELERHYASHHAHVCELDNCRCVFPDARLLELHQTECHDPLAAILKERGEKIFQCHLAAPTCGRSFQTPKARRLHLIQVHNYPKQYFFAVTNKGVGGLLRRWGEGASLVRGPWKPRDSNTTSTNPSSSEIRGQDGMDEDDDDDDDNENEEERDDDEDQPIQEDEDEEEAIDQSTPRIRPIRFTSGSSPHSSVSSKITVRGGGPHQGQNSGGANDDVGMLGITNAIESLTLVPDSVRFGRGGKRGFVGGPRGRGAPRGRGRGGFGRGGRGGAQEGGDYHMEVDNGPSVQHPGVIPLRGRGAAAANIRGGRGHPKVVNPNNSIAVRARGRGRGRGTS